MCACTLNRCASVCTYFLHSHSLTHACSPYRRAPVHTYQTYRRTLICACSNHRHTLRVCLKFPLLCTHSRIISVQARMDARLSLSRPCMGDPHPLHTPVRPPIQTLPKNRKPISMQDDQITNLILADHQSDASSSPNLQISSETAHPLTIAEGTNEVAMWAL
jgi:hypothetical protein